MISNNGNKTEPGVDILGLVQVLSGWVDVPEWAHKTKFHARYWFGFWAMRVMNEGLLEEYVAIYDGMYSDLDWTGTLPDDDDQAPVGVPA